VCYPPPFCNLITIGSYLNRSVTVQTNVSFMYFTKIGFPGGAHSVSEMIDHDFTRVRPWPLRFLRSRLLLTFYSLGRSVNTSSLRGSICARTYTKRVQLKLMKCLLTDIWRHAPKMFTFRNLKVHSLPYRQRGKGFS
jgi:hypothetical protein